MIIQNYGCGVFKQEESRYERAEGLRTSIKNPNETILLVKNSIGFLFMVFVLRAASY